MSDPKLQLRNAESSVLFLQQQHAKTLEGLYAEISKLQKKCGELTFQLAMNSTHINPDEESLREKSLKVEKDLEVRNHEITELKKLLESKTKHNVLLERSLRESQDNFEETVRTKDKKIALLTSELDAKAGSIAYLAKQLHDSKVAFAKLHEGLTNFDQMSMERSLRSPAPPEEKILNRRRYVRKVVATPNGNLDVESLSGLNPTTQKLLLNVKAMKSTEGFPSRSVKKKPSTPPKGSRSLTDAPKTFHDDHYLDFLRTDSRPEPKLVYKPAPNPLPPIMKGDGDNGTNVPLRVRRSRGQDPGIVDEIIVSPLNSPEKGWRQGSNQYDHVS